MAVAEKAITAAVAPRDQRQVLMLHSVLGGAYFLASVWLVFMGLPSLWRALGLSTYNEFLADSLLFLVIVPVVFGLLVLGRSLEGPHPVRGLRAGAFYLSFCIIVCGLLITSGSTLWAGIGAVLLVGALILFFQPFCLDWLVRVEEQGWFHAVSFKPNQGLRVRRGTVMGLMVVAICGIVTLVQHGTLRTGRGWEITSLLNSNVTSPAVDPWMVTMPFSGTHHVFMYFITLTIPVLIFVAASWLSWRLVNWPAFADFLIATEAEMNKVSWTTRKRLYQDTIVVLVTVILMTLFLFFVDILWIKILTNPLVDVLKHDPQAAARKNQAGAQW